MKQVDGKFNKNMEDSNSTIYQVDLIDIYTTFPHTSRECTVFFMCTLKIHQDNHIPGPKTNVNKFRWFKTCTAEFLKFGTHIWGPITPVVGSCSM